jgi:LysR family hydrogen peroxide-inducible transcriptional activator
MPTLRQLEYLVTIADTGSFIEAARLTNVAQPTLSQQLRALEDRLAVKLLERSSTGVVVTPIGRSIIAKARRMLSDQRDILALASSSSSGLTGIVRFGTTPTLGPYFLSPIIADLHQIAPGLRLHVREGIPDDQMLELSRGNLDVLLVPMPITGDDLVVEPLFREPLHLVSAVDNDLASEDTVERDALRDWPLLSLDPRHHLARQCAQIARSYGMKVAPDYYGTSLDSLHQMVASGLGLSILPSLYLKSDVGGSTGVSVLKVEGWNRHRSIALAWRRRSSMDSAFRLIAEHVQTCARRLLGPVDRFTADLP